MAARTIHLAINTASSGDLVLVSNGLYNTGGRTYNSEALTNRVVITNSITVSSVNGAGLTIIEGSRDSSSVSGFGPAQYAVSESAAVSWMGSPFVADSLGMMILAVPHMMIREQASTSVTTGIQAG